MKFLLQTQIGIESITELELEKKFKGKYSLDYTGYVPHKNGIVQIDCPALLNAGLRSAPESAELRQSAAGRKPMPHDFYKHLGTVEDAFLVLDYIGDIPGESTTRTLLEKLNINKIKKTVDFFFDNLNDGDKNASFRFITRKKAAHDFRRLDLNRSIKDFFDRNINRVKVTEDEGTKEIWTTLVKNRLIVALRLTSKEKRHGYYKTATVHGSLRPTVANAMCFVTDIHSKDTVWDPFCGAGTIGCELVDNFKFGKLILSDISEEALASTRENLSNTKGFKQFKAKVSAKNADFFESQDYAHTIITNLPFGSQYSIDSNFIQNLKDKLYDLKNLTQVTLLFPEVISLPGFQLTRKFELEVLGKSCWLCVYKKIS